MRRWISGIGRRAASGARDDVTDARRLMHDTVSRKGPERQLVVQVLKSVVAAMLAWLIAIHVLEVRQPFVAPMIALLMVQPTIVQSLVKGTQQVAAVTMGMVTALVVFGLVDSTVVALGIALLVTTGFAAWRRLGDQGTYAPIVALTMISLQSVGETYFERRLLETVVGVVVGAAINFAVKPPHYLDSARASATICVDDATGIMRDIAEGLRSGWSVDDARGWVARTDRLQSQVSSCLEDLGWAGESVRLNFRRNRVDDIPTGDRCRRKRRGALGALRPHAGDPRQGRPGCVAGRRDVPRRLRDPARSHRRGRRRLGERRDTDPCPVSDRGERERPRHTGIPSAERAR